MATVGTTEGTRSGHGAAHARRTARAAALLAAAVTVSLAAGCTSGQGDDGRTPVTPTPSASTAPSPSRSAPTATGPVLAVKIDNVPAARPQTGLNAADIVYVEQVEGGLSRLMAVYATAFPQSVGPVRSARESDLELLRQFDEPTLAFSGAQGKLLPAIDSAPVHAEPPGAAPDAYTRSTDRSSPHNLYLRPDRLIPRPPGVAALTTGFRFGPAPAGGTPVNSRTVHYPSAGFTFTWSRQRERWLVAMDGREATTTDAGALDPATVVVQHVGIRESAYHDSLGNHTPYTETVGSGTAEVLRDGKAYDARWDRPDAASGTRFTTEDGKPLDFATGQVWVVYVQE
ncbi:DUF3048 domain-containing protein [Streptomyces sp. NPDC091377]|uniref:DUF3048 domain-containing protein n=1 Tax=Streptomyces sp. NPDC091377 TaxID=3365995 RepID=UPI0037F27A2E